MKRIMLLIGIFFEHLKQKHSYFGADIWKRKASTFVKREKLVKGWQYKYIFQVRFMRIIYMLCKKSWSGLENHFEIFS